MPTTLTASKGEMQPWIVDTEASDHITRNKSLFQNYQADTSNSSVRIADGSYSKVAGTGTSSVRITQNLYLNFVLHVPDLDCNLLSISKLTRDFACAAKFYPNSCFLGF